MKIAYVSAGMCKRGTIQFDDWYKSFGKIPQYKKPAAYEYSNFLQNKLKNCRLTFIKADSSNNKLEGIGSRIFLQVYKNLKLKSKRKKRKKKESANFFRSIISGWFFKVTIYIYWTVCQLKKFLDQFDQFNLRKSSWFETRTINWNSNNIFYSVCLHFTGIISLMANFLIYPELLTLLLEILSRANLTTWTFLRHLISFISNRKICVQVHNDISNH